MLGVSHAEFVAKVRRDQNVIDAGEAVCTLTTHAGDVVVGRAPIEPDKADQTRAVIAARVAAVRQIWPARQA